MTKRPMTVHIFGNSISLLVTGLRGESPPYDTYASALAKSCWRDQQFYVTNHSRAFGMITDFSGSWLYPVAQDRPDVVILQFGTSESYPKIFPKRLIRRLQGNARHFGKVRQWVWSVIDRLLRVMFRFEGKLDRYLPMSWCRVSPRRFELELVGVSRRIIQQGGARLILMTAFPPREPLPFSNPKLDARVKKCNEAIQRVATRFDAEIFPLGDIVSQLGPAAVGDGVHLRKPAHSEVALRLAEFLASPAPPAPGESADARTAVDDQLRTWS